MTTLVEVAANGLGVGAAYGLVALAVVVAQRATRTMHLAIGAVVVAGGLVHLALSGTGTPTFVALAAGMTVGAVASAALEPLVLRPLAPGLPRLLGLVVAGAAIAALVGRTVGASTTRPDPLLILPDIEVGATAVSGAALSALLGASVVALIVVWILGSRWGARLRLVGGAPATADALGISSIVTRAGAMAVAGGLGVLALVLAAPVTLLGLPQISGVTLRAVAIAVIIRDRAAAALPVGIGVAIVESGVQRAWPAVGPEVAAGVVVLSALLVWGDRADGRGVRAW